MPTRTQTARSKSRSSASSSTPRRPSSRTNPGVLAVIKQEHEEVKQLFEDFQGAADQDPASAMDIARTIFADLNLHTRLEETIVYPSLKQEDEEIYSEAVEEHHVADILIAELKSSNNVDMKYKAKMMVLAENVKHHIQEEEMEAFKKLKQLPKEKLEEMGTQWEEQKAVAEGRG